MLAMLIGGRAVTGEASFEVVNPATEAVIANVPDCSAENLNEAVAAAQAALPAWSATPIEARRQLLLDCADLLVANIDELARLLVLEQGKPLPKATRELMGSAAWLRYTATLDLPVEIIRDDEMVRVELRHKPIGVVGAIVPWNYPVISAVGKFAPAMLAGNTVVLKPSPYTPLATLRLGELLRERIPAGVLNIVSGGDELGRRLTAHPGIQKLSLTGSVAAGRSVAAAAAHELKRITLELGGNDAAIVLGDVDVKKVAQKVFTAAFENSGQVCTAIKRVYVHDSIHDAFVAELVALATAARVGDGMAEGIDYGPINNHAQFSRVLGLIDSAKSEGGTVLCGGTRIGDTGYFIAPAIVTGLPDSARLVAEEQFGPALPVLRFSDIDDAVARANDSPLGLGGSVWSADATRAAEIADRLVCGTSWVNAHLMIVPQAPISGQKLSGIGAENGVAGLQAFTRLQTRIVPKS
ncbi:aldehyde dehydrogenase family protein [Solimonas flava]|uniref:aldehyde dehydrogenase family protein n=1 Tax=Solimonas flava TaxID=415849 RepID=UPI000412244D|nr:aldehyde dehydrogenase family protein [Solimonas flava]